MEDVENNNHQTQSWLPQYSLGVILFIVDKDEIILFDMIFHHKEHACEGSLQGLSATEEETHREVHR